MALTVVVSVLAGAVGGAAVTLLGSTTLFSSLASGTPLVLNRNSVSGPTPLNVQEESATTAVVKNVSPSVVSIIISKDLSKIYNQTGPMPYDPFGQGFPFNFFFNGQPVFPQTPQPQQPSAPQGKQEIGGGTGFVVDGSRGLILTNRHVVSDTQADYTVLTNDGRKFPAKVVARDTVNDMALVQIDDHSLPSVELGDSSSVVIGQTVIAIGNALGEYRNTVTKGVISGIGRNVTAGDNTGSSEQLQGVFQTDAAINPGNSGGPLVNLAGQVIGINTAVNSQGQLIGFTIPINEAKRIIQSYVKNGRIVRPYLGVRYVPITPELAQQNKLDVDYGALIVAGQNQGEVAVVPGSPADQAGLAENDIILAVNGQKVDQDHSLSSLLASFNPGDTVTLTVEHKGGKHDVRVTLQEFKQQ